MLQLFSNNNFEIFSNYVTLLDHVKISPFLFLVMPNIPFGGLSPKEETDTILNIGEKPNFMS